MGPLSKILATSLNVTSSTKPEVHNVLNVGLVHCPHQEHLDYLIVASVITIVFISSEISDPFFVEQYGTLIKRRQTISVFVCKRP